MPVFRQIGLGSSPGPTGVILRGNGDPPSVSRGVSEQARSGGIPHRRNRQWVLDGPRRNLVEEDHIMPYILGNRVVQIEGTGQRVGTGWVPPMIDPRDYTDDHPEIAPIVKKARVEPEGAQVERDDRAAGVGRFRPWCSPIENQLALGSCTAHSPSASSSIFSDGRSASTSMGRACSSTRRPATSWASLATPARARTAPPAGALVYLRCSASNATGRYNDIADYDVDPPAFVDASRQFRDDQVLPPRPDHGDVPKNGAHSVNKILAGGIPAMFRVLGDVVRLRREAGAYPAADATGAASDPQWRRHRRRRLRQPEEITSKMVSKTTTRAFLIRSWWGRRGATSYGARPTTTARGVSPPTSGR